LYRLPRPSRFEGIQNSDPFKGELPLKTIEKIGQKKAKKGAYSFSDIKSKKIKKYARRIGLKADPEKVNKSEAFLPKKGYRKASWQ
jgi:hypothetical protein